MRKRKSKKNKKVICEYSLCDKEIRESDRHVIDYEGKKWCVNCYDLFLYRDMASYEGYAIEKRIKELENQRRIIN